MQIAQLIEFVSALKEHQAHRDYAYISERSALRLARAWAPIRHLVHYGPVAGHESEQKLYGEFQQRDQVRFRATLSDAEKRLVDDLATFAAIPLAALILKMAEPEVPAVQAVEEPPPPVAPEVPITPDMRVDDMAEPEEPAVP